MSLRKSLFQWGGLAAIEVLIIVLFGHLGTFDALFIGILLAAVYFPVFNRLYKEQPESSAGGRSSPVSSESTSVEAEIEKLEAELHALLLSRSPLGKRNEQDEKIETLDARIKELKAIAASTKPPVGVSAPMQQANHRKRNVAGILVIGVIFAALLVSGLIQNSNSGGGVYGPAGPADVNITYLNWHYSCSNCVVSYWNYSLPFDQTLNENSAFSSPQSGTWASPCTTITSVYSITSGFTFNMTPLPKVLSINQVFNTTINLTTPNHPYSGPLDVEAVVSAC